MAFNNSFSSSNSMLSFHIRDQISPWPMLADNNVSLFNNFSISSQKSKIAKRTVSGLVKRIRNLNIGGAGGANEEDSNEHFNQEEADLNDLLELLEYLTLRRKLKTGGWNINTTNSGGGGFGVSNQSNLTQTELPVEEFELPVALVQLSIIVLVFLIVLCMCKCNEMMEWCRDCRRKQSIEQKRLQQFDDER